MKLVNPSFEIWSMSETDRTEYSFPFNYSDSQLKLIEKAGRLCYKSENKINDDSADKFVEGIRKKGHLSVIEHSWVAKYLPSGFKIPESMVTYRIDEELSPEEVIAKLKVKETTFMYHGDFTKREFKDWTFDQRSRVRLVSEDYFTNLAESCDYLSDVLFSNPHHLYFSRGINSNKTVVCGNIRAMEEFYGDIYLEFEDADLLDIPFDHMSATVKFICDRGCCYDKETEVLTKEGWKLFEDVSLSDQLATLNPENKEIEFKHPNKLYSYDWNGELIEFKNQMIDLLVTPNHNVYFFDYDKRSPDTRIWKIDKAENVINKRIKFKRNGVWKGRDKEYITIPKRKDKSENYQHGHKFKTSDFLEFLGYFISEGTLDHTNGGSYRIIICQKKIKNKRKIELCINRLGFKAKFKNGYIKIYSYSLYKYLEPIGLQPVRYIYKNIKSLSSKYLMILWNALILGDGNIHKKNGQTVYYTTSKKLADDLQEIALKIGLSANIRIDDRVGESHYSKSINATIKHNYICYIVSLNKTKNEPLINHNNYKTGNYVKYKGKVFCVNIDNHIIYVRRNGIPVWSGNSHELIRHRKCAYSQVSTRYVDFQTSDIEFIILSFYSTENIGIIPEFSFNTLDEFRNIMRVTNNSTYNQIPEREEWIKSLLNSEVAYKEQRRLGTPPQIARSVLPNSLKTEIAVTASFEEWAHIFKMRCSVAAHPQIRELMLPLLYEFRKHHSFFDLVSF